jgi:Family of unknown function (DUF6387)
VKTPILEGQMKIGREESFTKRRLLKEIPPWFKIANYQRVAGLDALGWYGQINVRRVCSSQLQNMSEEILPEWDRPIREALFKLRTSPLADSTSQPFSHLAFRWCFGFKDVPALSVRSMLLKDLFRVERAIRPKLTKAQIERAEQLVSDQSSGATARFFLGSPEWMDETIENECIQGGFAALMINLNFPNQLLMKHFGQHLQRLRRIPGGSPKQAAKKSPTLGRWAEMGVLPCMDLLLWAEEQNGRLPDRLIADALEPSETRGEEQIRKVIRPLASGLMLIQGSYAHVELERLRELAHADWLDRQKVRQRRQAHSH